MRQVTASYTFNRGLISALGLARTDQKRVSLGAEVMTNWMPRVLGPMSLRPGLGYIGSPPASNSIKMLPFIFATTDTALIELTHLLMRVWIDDELVTRGSVSSAINNGTFAGNISGWTVSGGNVTYAATNQMQFVSNGTADETAYQLVDNLNPNTEHAVHIVVNRGPIRFRVGSTVGAQDYVSETTLGTGTHSLAFTPSGNFTVYFLSARAPAVLLGSCTIEAAGVMSLTTPWRSADMDNIRSDQSGDIIFVACKDIQQRKIERRADHSWSVVLYEPEDGPFEVENVSPTTITATDLNGDTTLTASKDIFKSTNVGGLYYLTSTGQTVSKDVTAANDVTNSIRVTGVGTDRAFTIVETGFTGGGRTIILQSSFDDSTFTAVAGKSWTADTTESYNDALDNQIIYYRLKCTATGSAGTTVVSLSIATGSITGIARITAFSSATVVSAQVLSDFGSTAATDVWAEGNWSDRNGFPTAVRLHEGRLWWFGKNGIWGSISDAFDEFDPFFEGDAGPINRTIGSGPVDTINWGISLQRLVIGAEGAELSIGSSTLDEPISPTNFNIKTVSTQGSAPVEAVKIDQHCAYIQRGGVRVYDLAFDAGSYAYGSQDLTAVIPELGDPGIVRMAVQRQPDTRIHCVRSDGTAAVAVFDAVEQVIAWTNVETHTDCVIEDVVVLPGPNAEAEDQVYYVMLCGATEDEEPAAPAEQPAEVCALVIHDVINGVNDNTFERGDSTSARLGLWCARGQGSVWVSHDVNPGHVRTLALVDMDTGSILFSYTQSDFPPSGALYPIVGGVNSVGDCFIGGGGSNLRIFKVTTAGSAVPEYMNVSTNFGNEGFLVPGGGGDIWAKNGTTGIITHLSSCFFAIGGGSCVETATTGDNTVEEFAYDCSGTQTETYGQVFAKMAGGQDVTRVSTATLVGVKIITGTITNTPVVFGDDGNLYVSRQNGTGTDIEKYDRNGTLLASLGLPAPAGGAFWQVSLYDSQGFIWVEGQSNDEPIQKIWAGTMTLAAVVPNPVKDPLNEYRSMVGEPFANKPCVSQTGFGGLGLIDCA